MKYSSTRCRLKWLSNDLKISVNQTIAFVVNDVEATDPHTASWGVTPPARPIDYHHVDPLGGGRQPRGKLASRVVDWLGLIVVGTTVALLGFAWLYAWHEGAASAAAFAAEGNHGPWRHAYDARSLLEWSIVIPLLSALPLGVMALVFCGQLRWSLISLSLGVLIVISHFWLID